FEASGEQALAQLQRELSATAQTQPQWGVQSVLLGEALVLTPTRGALPELSSEGLELSYHHSESEAPAYLLIMLTLVLLLLPLCGWLFGVLLEPS
ncbi:MAG: hypothetical protein RBU37_01710, partial [Myxococcota bacterium]|nr:hypothetical protein [Myxococcota bacterium]